MAGPVGLSTLFINSIDLCGVSVRRKDDEDTEVWESGILLQTTYRAPKIKHSKFKNKRTGSGVTGVWISVKKIIN